MKQLVKVTADVTVHDNKLGKTALHGSIETGDLHLLVMKVCAGV